jgi:hypothetical protein
MQRAKIPQKKLHEHQRRPNQINQYINEMPVLHENRNRIFPYNQNWMEL